MRINIDNNKIVHIALAIDKTKGVKIILVDQKFKVIMGQLF